MKDSYNNATRSARLEIDISVRFNGVDEKMRIKNTSSPHPFLYNIPTAFVNRFRQQLSVIDLQFEGDPDVIRKAVWACYQEKPVQFRDYTLYDPGAY